MQALTPAVVGLKLAERYRIVRAIARGGMGAVYEAEDERIGRRVAVKVLLDELAGDPTCAERFRREARAVASINHASLVPLYDLSLDTHPAFLVMELVDGTSLASMVTSEGRLAWPRVAALAIDVLDGLACLHDQGVVHRDLKPANILVVRAGGQEHAKVIDLGVAQLALGATYQRLTASGAIVGTPAFMAPEQLEGRPVDAAADLWALGLVIHHALTGQHAFEAQHVGALLLAIRESPPTPLASLAPDVPPALVELVAEMLAKDPEARPSSARSAAGRLRDLLGLAPRMFVPAAGGASAGAARGLQPSSASFVDLSLPYGSLPHGSLPHGSPPHAHASGVDAPAVSLATVLPRREPGPTTRAIARSTRFSALGVAMGALGVLATCGVGIALAALMTFGRPDAGAGAPGAPRLVIRYEGPNQRLLEASVAPALEPRLRACVDVTRAQLGQTVTYMIHTDPPAGGPMTHFQLSGAPRTPEESACLETALRSASWPSPPSGAPLAASAFVTLTINL